MMYNIYNIVCLYRFDAIIVKFRLNINKHSYNC